MIYDIISLLCNFEDNQMAFKDTNVKPVIEPIVDNLESVNEKYRDLYAETTDGKFQIMADIAFQSDFENVRKALNAERELNKGNQSKIKELQAVIDSYDGIDPTAAKGMKNEPISVEEQDKYKGYILVFLGKEYANRIGVAGYGDTRLKNTADPLSAENRRIEIRILWNGKDDK